MSNKSSKIITAEQKTNESNGHLSRMKVLEMFLRKGFEPMETSLGVWSRQDSFRWIIDFVNHVAPRSDKY